MAIYLLGDSIRLHAEPYVKQALSPLSISAPAENCRSSDILVNRIAQWAPAKPEDIVHLNCGLHDIRHDAGSHQAVNSLTQYRLNLIQIFDYLAQRQTRTIWATSTPFNQTTHNQAKQSQRYAEDIIRYNSCSIDLARSYGFAVNDVYAVVNSVDYESLLLPDGLHYNENGSRLIGETIAHAIRLANTRSASIK